MSTYFPHFANPPLFLPNTLLFPHLPLHITYTSLTHLQPLPTSSLFSLHFPTSPLSSHPFPSPTPPVTFPTLPYPPLHPPYPFPYPSPTPPLRYPSPSLPLPYPSPNPFRPSLPLSLSFPRYTSPSFLPLIPNP